MHGFGASKESFYYQTEFFSRYFKVTAPDFPDFGHSEKLSCSWSVGDYAEWLKRFIWAAKLNCPHIMAHSFGARVAIKLLSENGRIADRLIITGGAGIVKPRTKKYLRRVKTYRAVKKIFPKFAEKHFGSKEYRSLSPVQKESYKKIVNEDLRGFAAKIGNKTCLIYGADDRTTPFEEEGKIFYSLIEGSRLYRVRGGHFCFSEYPDEFNEIALKFLTEKI